MRECRELLDKIVDVDDALEAAIAKFDEMVMCYAPGAGQLQPNGGQPDVVRSSARAMHPHGCCASYVQMGRDETKKNTHPKH